MMVAATGRVKAAISKKNFSFSGVTEKLLVTITVGTTFSFRGLTKKEISVIMGLRRKEWG